MRLTILAAATVALLAASAANASEFKADMVRKIEGQKLDAKIYVKGDRYRMDQEQGGERIFVIVDQAKNLTRVFNPQLKQYMEMKSDSFESCMNDPFQSVKKTAATGKSKKQGVVQVGGRKCTDYVISLDGRDVMSQCVSDELSFPIRVTALTQGKRTVELLDVKEGALDDALFEMPAGYELIDRPGAKKQR